MWQQQLTSPGSPGSSPICFPNNKWRSRARVAVPDCLVASPRLLVSGYPAWLAPISNESAAICTDDAPTNQPIHPSIILTNFGAIFFFTEYKQRFPTFSSPLMERMRKRRAFADPELNHVMEATLGGNALYFATVAAAVQQEQHQQQHHQNLYQSMPPPANTLVDTPRTRTMQLSSTAKKPKLSFSIESIMGIST